VLQELNDIVNKTYNDALLNKAVQEYVETTKDF
jgi:hypothetical protein